MKHGKKVFVLAISLCLYLVSSVWAVSTETSHEVMEARQEFESRCPKPQWWDRISVGDVKINTYDDLLHYWQDKERSISQFFKAAYQAVLDCPLDQDIVVNATKLMYYAYSYPHRTALQEYAIEKYFGYNSPYGRPGDSIAGIARNLGELYNDASQFKESVDIIERVLKEREGEINDHMLELLHLTYAEALDGLDRPAEAVSILKKAVSEFDGSWEKRLNQAIARYEGTTTTDTPEPLKRAPKKGKSLWTNYTALIGGVVLVLLCIVFLRSRSTHRSTKSHMHTPPVAGTSSAVESLIREGRKIDAIKRYRQVYNVGLKEAKEAVDQIAERVAKEG